MPLVALLLAPAADGASKPKPRAFSSCAKLNSYARQHTLKIFGDQGVPFRFGFPAPAADLGTPMPTTMEEGAPQQDSSGGEVRQGTDFSGTNVQEEGVDEPDFVKTDGKYIYVATNSTVRVLDVRDGTPKLVGSLELKGFGHQLLISGDRLLALTTYYDDPVLAAKPPNGEPQEDSREFAPTYSEPATRLFEIDISDRTAPKLLNTFTVEGFYVSARLIGSTARIVVSTPPDPVYTVDEETIREDAEPATWIPDGVLRDRIKRKRRRTRVVACDDVRRPAAFSGPGMLTLLTLDLEQGLEPIDSDSILTDAQTIYASKKNLFVATERWFDPLANADIDSGRHTAIHRFDISSAGSGRYKASGTVRGFVLNQFSLSEHDGNLRVATTDEPLWREGGEQRESESYVSVFDADLKRLGQVGGLGKGERIYSVRFMGDRGYVVTFRQVDPLYALDLSDPANPAVRGELKILGFSAYLHPIGDDLLLGVGQDATEEGRTKGTQVSLFDVSDLDAPSRLHQWSVGEYSSSSAEYDHHAFLYWPPTKLSVIPLSYWNSENDQFAGAVGLSVDRGSGISEIGRVQHEKINQYGYDYYPLIERSLVAAGRLFTVSSGGVLASTLDKLEPAGYEPFPQPESGGCCVVVEDGGPPPPEG